MAASAALIARHSIVPEVGAGRPDEKDQEEIRDFAKSVLEKLRTSFQGTVKVPGNDPYKEAMNMPATPISLPVCNQCKHGLHGSGGLIGDVVGDLGGGKHRIVARTHFLIGVLVAVAAEVVGQEIGRAHV